MYFLCKKSVIFVCIEDFVTRH